MKKIKKTGVQIFLLALMFWVLAGCGDGSASSPKDDKDDIKEAREESKKEESKKDKKIDIKKIFEEIKKDEKNDIEETSVEDSSGKYASEPQDTEIKTIDDLWRKLDGVWRLQEYTYRGKEALYSENNTREFRYIDNKPCIIETTREDGAQDSWEEFFCDFAVVDENNYNVYLYKKGSDANEKDAKRSDDILLIWYGFDLKNISNGELFISYNMSFDNGFVDDNHLFRYQKEK